MDMELQRAQLGGSRLVYEGLIRQEETLESIVPDALPDISRIVDASGMALFRQKEAAEGSVRVGGSVSASVLYVPEGGGAPCCLPLNIPFLCSGDDPAICADCRTQASVTVIYADAQLLNPRKVVVRVEVAVQITAYGAESSELSLGVVCGEDSPIQTLMEGHQDFVAADVAEKNFNFSDVLQLPASRPAMEQLLSARGSLNCGEAKVIGSKLVAKGDAVLTVCYLGERGVASARFELPFSQIMEVQGGEDESIVWTDAALTGLDCAMRSESELEVSFDVLLQAVVRQKRDVQLLADLYSTDEPLETELETVWLTQLADQGTRRQLARQLCPCAVPVKQVIQCRLSVGELSQAPAGDNNLAVTAQTHADMLYLSEDDTLCAASFQIPVACEVPVPANCRCLCRCRLTDEAAATPVTDGAEVRFEAEFCYLVVQRYSVRSVSAVHPGQQTEDAVARPSVVVRMAGEGERLWDIAKYSGSTIADIQAVNGISGDEVTGGTILLIPKCG
jgi:hypothetical protein